MTKGDSDDFLEELNRVIVHNDVHFNTRARVDRLFEAGVAPAYDRNGHNVWANADAYMEYFRLSDEFENAFPESSDVIAKRQEISRKMKEVWTNHTIHILSDADHYPCDCWEDSERTDFPVLRVESEIDNVVSYRHFEAYRPTHDTIYPYHPEPIVDEWPTYTADGDPE